MKTPGSFYTIIYAPLVITRKGMWQGQGGRTPCKTNRAGSDTRAAVRRFYFFDPITKPYLFTFTKQRGMAQVMMCLSNIYPAPCSSSHRSNDQSMCHTVCPPAPSRYELNSLLHYAPILHFSVASRQPPSHILSNMLH